MARGKARNRGKSAKTSYMFPSLHQDVMSAVSDEIASPHFHMNDSDSGVYNTCSTHVMGTFVCNNSTCANHGWASKKVAILIRGYPRNGYNAVVFNQRCKSCNKLGTLKMDEESYVDRVAYRLKKWAGVRMEKPSFGRKKGLPHKSELYIASSGLKKRASVKQ
ncbi:zf-3CxxC domain-containing protein [Pyrenophora tritici-repentis]|nr:zf-3CxxC domain-containing protein [Pyrenophora tritici-repentis]PZD22989.1 zf-3CxxC domain containing protein [Pyrenophora tritici-repentis]